MKSNSLLSLIGAFMLTTLFSISLNAQAITKILLNEDFNKCDAPLDWVSTPNSDVVQLSYSSNVVQGSGVTMSTPEFDQCIALFDDYIGQSEALSGSRCLETSIMDLSNPNYFNARLSLDWLLSKEGGKASFTIEGWNGTDWADIYATTGNGKGMWSSMVDPNFWLIDNFVNNDFKVKFCYNEPTVQWNNGLGLDNVIVRVEELIGGGGSGLPCEDMLNISADSDCQIGITPEIYLVGQLGPGVAYSDYTVYIDTIDNPGISDAVRGTNNTDHVMFDMSLIPDFKRNGMYGPIKVSVREIETGNYCWGYAMLETKLPPIIDSVADITVSCLVAALPNLNPDTSVTKSPTISDISCVDGDITFEDDITLSDCSLSDLTTRVIRRIFTITSPKMMSVMDTQYITVLALEETLLGPTAIIVLSCEDDDTPFGIASLLEYDSIDAYPHVDDATGVWILEDGAAQCNAVATYDDGSYISVCNDCAEGQGTVKFVRKWTILNWCSGTVITKHQVIKKMDNTPPEFGIEGNIIYRETTAWSCEVDVLLPEPMLTDNCDNTPFLVSLTGHDEYKNPIEIVGLEALHVPVGRNEFTYYASDCCGNLKEFDFTVRVTDVTPPVAISKEFLVISLTDSGIDGDEPGIAKLFAHHVNNGSYDNCTPVHLEIRRDHNAPACLNIGDPYQDEDDNTVYHNNNITYNDEYTYPNNDFTFLHIEDSEYDTDFGEYVKFCCEDLSSALYDIDGDGVLDAGYVKVWLRVWDDANRTGVYGDGLILPAHEDDREVTPDANAVDLYNETWAYVKVEDKRVPVIEADDVVIYCDDDLDWIINEDEWTSVEPGGYNEYNQNIPAPYIENTLCAAYILQYKDTLVDLNSCNVGHFVREYRLLNLDSTLTYDKDWMPVEDRQWIDVDLTNGDITFDWDEEEEGIQPYPNYLYHWNSCFLTENDVVLPIIDGLVCDLLGRKITIEEYQVGDGGGCRKWYVTYDYINWCETCDVFPGDFDPTDNINAAESGNYAYQGCGYDGLYHQGIYHTIYKYEDTLAPVIVMGCDTIIKGAIDASCAIDIQLNPVAEDNSDCNLALRWTVRVVADGSGTNDWYDTAEGSAPTFTVTNLTPGHYTVYYEVYDACDNIGKCQAEIWIDGKDPTPYCVSLHTAVMVDGSVTLWAIDFDKESFTNCVDAHLFFTFNNKVSGEAEHPHPDLFDYEHYFYGLGQVFVDDTKDYKIEDDVDGYTAFISGTAQKWNPEAYSSARYFSCLPLSNPQDDIILPNVIEMRVWDLSQFTKGTDVGSDYCIVTLDLQDHQGVCSGAPATGEIIGEVKTVEGLGVDDVEMLIEADYPGYPKFTKTLKGAYKFINIKDDLLLEVTAQKGGDYDNGASSLDLVMIQRHILGMSKFTSGYKILAADINNDEEIKVSDLVELRKVVLGVKQEFTNASWRFVVADQEMDDEHPFPFMEMKMMEDILEETKVDFVAVKIGDVNGDAKVNADQEVVQPRSKGLVFVIDERKVSKGENVEVVVRAKNFKEIYGYQFTANLKGLQLIGVEDGMINMPSENIGRLNDQIITTSWTDPRGKSFDANEVLYTMKFEVIEDGMLSNMIGFNSSVISAEAYLGSNLNQVSAQLEIRDEQDELAYRLYQNKPNPFKDLTEIGFSLAEDTDVSFKVFDVTGKILLKKEIKASKGLNTISVSNRQLNAAGMLYYQIESTEFTKVKKMIILE